MRSVVEWSMIYEYYKYFEFFKVLPFIYHLQISKIICLFFLTLLPKNPIEVFEQKNVFGQFFFMRNSNDGLNGSNFNEINFRYYNEIVEN